MNIFNYDPVPLKHKQIASEANVYLHLSARDRP